MYENWMVSAAVVLGTVAVVVACVLVHYEGLLQTSRVLAHLDVMPRAKVLLGILAIITLHVLEIWFFGLMMWSMLHWPECGFIKGADPLGVLDAVYFSAVTFSTVGFGDLTPVGPIRFMAATEALTGFVLITWSASFTFLDMERFWRKR